MYQQPMMNNGYYPQYQQAYQQRNYLDMTSMPQQYQQQILQSQVQQQQQTPLNGRLVSSFEEITANDVPMDGSGAIFVKRDGSMIQVRSWNANGTISSVTYKPSLDAEGNNNTQEQEKRKFDLSDEATDAFMKRFDELNEKIDKFIRPVKGRKEVADE